MVAEENILKFLEGFSKDSKVDSRVLKMFTSASSCECDVLGMAEDLVRSSVNVENLRFILDQYREEVPEGTAVFEGEGGQRDKFRLFSAAGEEHGGAENFANEPDEKLSEEMTKRPKMCELQGSVNKYSGEDTGDVVDSLKNSPCGCFIPGLDNTISEEDSNNGQPGASELENGLEIPQSNRPGKHPRSTSKSRGSRTHKSTAEPGTSKHGATRDSVFSQNVLAGSAAASQKPRDPIYLYPVLQCKLCGLRFAKDCTEQFGLHIEDHRRKTKALGDKMVLRREFFSSKSVSKMEKLDLEVEGGTESIIWDKEPPHCVICSKIIKKMWSDDAENWILDSGTRINDKEFAHRDCVL